MLALKFPRRKAIGEGRVVTQTKRKQLLEEENVSLRFEKVSVMIKLGIERRKHQFGERRIEKMRAFQSLRIWRSLRARENKVLQVTWVIVDHLSEIH